MNRAKKLSAFVFTVLAFNCFVIGVSSAQAFTKSELIFKNSVVDSPEAVIKEVYAIHAQDMKANRDRIIDGKSRKYLDKYFEKNLADYIWKDLTTHTDEVGVLDFDVFYNAQDFDIKKLVIGRSKITGGKAVVPVSFTNAGRRENLTYSLTQEKGAWKISDIRYGKTDSLIKYFKEDAKNNK